MDRIGPLIGSGKVAETFEYGSDALKLYRNPEARSTAFAEAAILAIVGDHGLPVPQAIGAGHFAGRWGLVMSRASGRPLAELALSDAALVPAVLDAMVALHLRVHRQTELRLHPLKLRLADRLAAAPRLGDGLRRRLLALFATLPDGNRLCHGDFHPFNLIGSPADATIVDWPDATAGPPAADACRSYLLMLQGGAQFAEPYLERYAAASGLARGDILAWLPVLAAARLCENVPEEEDRLLELARA